MDGLSDILVRAIEEEGTSYKDDLEITTRSAQDKTTIKELDSLPSSTQKMVGRYYKQKKTFNDFDKMQKSRRTELSDERQELDSAVYEHLMKNNPETLEDEYVFTDPETGEENTFKVVVKQTTKGRNIPKSDIKQFIHDAVEETIQKLYPKTRTDNPFDKKDCKYLMEDTFVEAFYDNVINKMQQRSDELQSFVTHVSMERKGFCGSNEDSNEDE